MSLPIAPTTLARGAVWLLAALLFLVSSAAWANPYARPIHVNGAPLSPQEGIVGGPIVGRVAP